MPTYEYQCETCGIRFERWQRMTDEPLRQCPECEGAVHRVLFPVGIVFKGSGFYCTDNRSGSSSMTPAKAKEEGQKLESSEKSADKDKKEESKADKKEAAKPAS